MKTQVTRLTERGQVSVPADVRARMGLEPGARLEWEVISEHECRVRRSPGRRPAGARAARGFAKQFRALRSTRSWMAELREGDA